MSLDRVDFSHIEPAAGQGRSQAFLAPDGLPLNQVHDLPLSPRLFQPVPHVQPSPLPALPGMGVGMDRCDFDAGVAVQKGHEFGP